MNTEALKLALEALEASHLLIHGVGTKGGLVYCMDGYYSGCFDIDSNEKQTNEAITAIKAALAQPEQEPVGQLLEDAFGRGQVMWFNKPKDESMLYTTPPQEQRSCDRRTWGKPWVSLTFAEICECENDYLHLFARAVEAKLKEKNT